MPDAQGVLTMKEVCERSGTTPVTLRYYEKRGLIAAERTSGNRRVYHRHVLRRLAVITAGQRVGMSLRQISQALEDVPAGRPITKAEWENVSRRWKADVQRRLALLHHLSDELHACIGCGCLSLTSCPLYNPDDTLAEHGSGPHRWRDALVRDVPDDVNDA